MIILFSLLYIAVGFVSTIHSISFFEISNQTWLAIILSISFEIGQAAVLFSLLTSKTKRIMPWILMGVLTLVQVLGNVYSSYSYMMINNPEQIKYFTDSVLFYLQDPNPKVNQVMVSYITGAILPIVSLCMTSMVVNSAGLEKQAKEQEDEQKNEYNEEEIKVETTPAETYPFNLTEQNKEDKNISKIFY